MKRFMITTIALTIVLGVIASANAQCCSFGTAQQSMNYGTLIHKAPAMSATVYTQAYLTPVYSTPSYTTQNETTQGYSAPVHYSTVIASCAGGCNVTYGPTMSTPRMAFAPANQGAQGVRCGNVICNPGCTCEMTGPTGICTNCPVPEIPTVFSERSMAFAPVNQGAQGVSLPAVLPMPYHPPHFHQSTLEIPLRIAPLEIDGQRRFASNKYYFKRYRDGIYNSISGPYKSVFDCNYAKGTYCVGAFTCSVCYTQ